jgi:hypothetical protein
MGLALVMCFALTGAASAAGTTAANPSDAVITPPARPLAITASQAAALEALAQQPEYAVADDTRAAYSPGTNIKVSEVSAVGTYVAYFGGLTWLLIAAAPL